MRTIAVAHLIGRLGGDPDMRFAPDGLAITKFNLATDRPARAGAPKETDWHRVVCFRRLAEFTGEHLDKGRLVYVTGRLTYRTWEDRDGHQRRGAEIIATEVIALDRPPARTEQDEDAEDGDAEDAPPLSAVDSAPTL